jgi:hypothetical protein
MEKIMTLKMRNNPLKKPCSNRLAALVAAGLMLFSSAAVVAANGNVLGNQGPPVYANAKQKASQCTLQSAVVAGGLPTEATVCLAQSLPDGAVCPVELTAVVRMTYTFLNPELTVDTPRDSFDGTDEAENFDFNPEDSCESMNRGSANITTPWEEQGDSIDQDCPMSDGNTGTQTCQRYRVEYTCEGSSAIHSHTEMWCGVCHPKSELDDEESAETELGG